MRVMVTGAHGYIGSVLAPMLAAEGHDVLGLDNDLFERCQLLEPIRVPSRKRDIRDVEVDDLRGFDAVIHLAALCNDPLCNLDRELTYEINHHASARLAEVAKKAKVPRFLFSSSCSMYGISGDQLVTEEAALAPVTDYGRSKVLVERDLSALADEHFSPVYLRNATAYGLSPRLRMDLVINELAAHACTTGRILIKSDGTPWRPLVHVEDIARAFAAVLRAPREAIHNQAFNVGRNEDNCRVRELAEMVREAVPGSEIEYAAGGGPDQRCYRVDCRKFARTVPAFQPRWRVKAGIRQLVKAYRQAGLTAGELEAPRFYRLRRLRELMDSQAIDGRLRWRGAAAGET